jgi:hypothetical protein
VSIPSWRVQLAKTLARISGLHELACLAWLTCEGNGQDSTNPLNVRYWGRPAQIGQTPTGFAIYRDANAGLVDAWDLVRELAPAHGYGAIVSSAKFGDPITQCAAIEASDWAAGHYGRTATTPGCLSRFAYQYRRCDSMLNLSGYPLKHRILRGTPFYETPRDKELGLSPAVLLGADSDVQLLGRCKDPSGWYLARVNTAGGWPDKVQRPTGLYVYLPDL